MLNKIIFNKKICESIFCPKDKPKIKIKDKNGLILVVDNLQTKLWEYEYSVNKKKQIIYLGKYKELQLDEAKLYCKIIKNLLIKKINPKNYLNKLKNQSLKYIKDNSEIKVGDYTYGSENIKVLHAGEGYKIRIGKFCSLAAGIKIFTGANHRTDFISTYPFGHIENDISKKINVAPIPGHPKSSGNVIIGNDVYIGYDTTIMSGIKIGHGAVIAANSHLTKSVKPYEIWGGNPAQKIKDRFDKETISELLKLKWWNYEIKKIKRIIPLLAQEYSSFNLDQIKKLLK